MAQATPTTKAPAPATLAVIYGDKVYALRRDLLAFVYEALSNDHFGEPTGHGDFVEWTGQPIVTDSGHDYDLIRLGNKAWACIQLPDEEFTPTNEGVAAARAALTAQDQFPARSTT